MSNAFAFKQFTVSQENAIFKVGTDSVVLGAWARVQRAERILDIGTGTGLLALMCAQRNENAIITGIEKDGLSYLDAVQNFSNSPWGNRLTAVQIALEDCSTDEKFDYIICNPPYFMQALLPSEPRKADARHASKDFFSTLADMVVKLASDNACFGCILPLDEFEFLSTELYNRYWNLVRTQKLLSSPDGNKLRVLAEWKKDAWINKSFPPICVRDENGNFSKEYRELTQDFYLKF